jgi:hypothetical protein
MIVLISGVGALDRFGRSDHVGRLVVPRGGNVPHPGEPWAADNDAFGAWDEGRFVAMLGRCEVYDRSRCLFVAAPDVVGDARATLDRFWGWRYEIAGRGLPVALVGQDGAEDLELPWDAFDAFFVGGSTDWKLSAAAADLVDEANRRGLWTHMGRVNTNRRLKVAREAGCKSVDGTGWSMFPDTYMAKHLPVVVRLTSQALVWDVATR